MAVQNAGPFDRWLATTLGDQSPGSGWLDQWVTKWACPLCRRKGQIQAGQGSGLIECAACGWEGLMAELDDPAASAGSRGSAPELAAVTVSAPRERGPGGPVWSLQRYVWAAGHTFRVSPR